MSDNLANLLASKFISRTDVKAIQHSDGAYHPDRRPWTRTDLEAHVGGVMSLGHYLLGQDSTTKLFAFDVDLEKNKYDSDGNLVTYGGVLPTVALSDQWTDSELATWETSFAPCDPRDAWRDRSHVGRPYMKRQFRTIAHKLMSAIHTELGIPCAAAYSGNKGIHVYGFTGKISATDAREGANIVLESLGDWQPSRGENFFKCTDTDPMTGFPNFSIEVFPKQNSLEGKDLGNLMRLPLGRNFKTPDPTFFIDMTSPLSELSPVDPEYALTTMNPWARPGE